MHQAYRLLGRSLSECKKNSYLVLSSPTQYVQFQIRGSKLHERHMVLGSRIHRHRVLLGPSALDKDSRLTGQRRAKRQVHDALVGRWIPGDLAAHLELIEVLQGAGRALPVSGSAGPVGRCGGFGQQLAAKRLGSRYQHLDVAPKKELPSSPRVVA